MSKDALLGPALCSPKVLCDHDRVAVLQSMRHWHDALPDEVLANPGEHSWRVRGVREMDVRMDGHHRIRCCMPDGTMDLLFIPRDQPPPVAFAPPGGYVEYDDCVVHDLSGNGRDMHGVGYSPAGKSPVANFDAEGDFAKSLAPLPSEPAHLPPRVCK